MAAASILNGMETSLPDRRTLLKLIVLFCVLTFLVYGWSLGSAFVRWDDGMLIYENPVIRELNPQSVARIFTMYDPELYIPLTFLSYQIDYQIAGVNPWIYHFDNLVLHTLNALLVAWLLLLLLKNRWAALAGGIIFALHPLHTEAVMWASARKDVLSTFFYLLAFIGYLRYRETDLRRPYMWSLLFFLLGLLSKIMVVTLPAALILADLWQGRKLDRTMIKDKLPYAALALVFTLVAFGGKQAVVAGSTTAMKILMAGKSAIFYLQQILWPAKLSLLYPYVGDIALREPAFYIPWAILLALIIAAIALRRRLPELWFALALYVMTLAPTFMNFAKGDVLDLYFASDRYAYIPSIAVIFFVVALLTRRLQRPPWMGATVLGAVTLLLVVLSYKQSLVWKNTETLLINVIRLYPDSSHVAHNNLGNAYRIEKRYDEAIREFEAAIAVRPTAKAYSNKASVLRLQGKRDEAFVMYQKAIELEPKSAVGRFGLGTLYAEQGNFSGAEAEYRAAMELDPSYEEIPTNLGSLLLKTGRADEAITMYERAIAANPYYAPAHFNLGIAFMQQKRVDEALTHYEEAIAIQPDLTGARINAGLLYHATGRFDEAAEQFRAILRYDPGNDTARSALEQMGIAP